MSRVLSMMLLLGLAAAPVLAEEYEGGNLQVVDQFAIGAPIMGAPSVLTPDYSNVTNFLGTGYAPAGAALQGTNTITRLLADDCTPTGVHAGFDVTEFRFTLVNFNAVDVSFRPRVRFWFADGAGGAPGTYYNVPGAVGYTFNPVTVPAGSATTFFATLPAGQFTMPGSTLWAGMTFDNNSGGTGATAAELNLIGMGIFNPPTVGTSADRCFVTNAAGSFFNVNNPVGALTSFNGNPPANFGWAFSVDVPTPNRPSTWGRVKAIYVR